MASPLVSVIIPTYNRYEALNNAVKSVLKQTYANIEVIVVDDCSPDERYLTLNFDNNKVTILRLEKNTRSVFKYPCAGYVRNQGINIAKGEYIAFLDDDDIWFPTKIQEQLKAMEHNNCYMSCTDIVRDFGFYDPTKEYRQYIINSGNYKRIFSKFIELNGGKFPNIINKNMFHHANIIVCSSVIVHKEIIRRVKNLNKSFKPFTNSYNGREDRTLWENCLKTTNCIFVQKPLVYYDKSNSKK